jgi:hypothetical protein
MVMFAHDVGWVEPREAHRFGVVSRCMVGLRSTFDPPYGWLLCWALLLFTGCGGDGRRAVSGDVSLDGEAVNGGSIVFLPAAGEGSKGAAEIVDGKYAIPPEQGLPPGNYRVEIRWSKPTGKQIPSGDPGMLMDERLEAMPAKYNSDSTLTAEITAGENEHSFKLPK